MMSSDKRVPLLDYRQTAKYPDRWKYFSRDLVWGSGPEAVIVFNLLTMAADLARGGILLDYGSGFRRYEPFFEDSLYVAQEHPQAGIQNKGIVDYDIVSEDKIPLKDESVDVVLSTSSLEHVERPELFFKESFRVLAPGGAIVIQCPFAYPEHEAPYDFQRLTRYGLRRSLRAAGFEVELSDIQPVSSTLETINAFMKQAIFEDVTGGTRDMIRATNPKLAFLSADVIRRPVLTLVGQVRLVTHLMRNQLASRVFLFGVGTAFKWLSPLVDNGPRMSSLMPLGWACIARRPGAHERRPRSATQASKKEFLVEMFSGDPDFELREGRLIQKTGGVSHVRR